MHGHRDGWRYGVNGKINFRSDAGPREETALVNHSINEFPERPWDEPLDQDSCWRATHDLGIHGVIAADN